MRVSASERKRSANRRLRAKKISVAKSVVSFHIASEKHTHIPAHIPLCTEIRASSTVNRSQTQYLLVCPSVRQLLQVHNKMTSSRNLLLITLLVIGLISIVMIEPVAADFEMQCMQKCATKRNCKKYGVILIDAKCESSCKRKCYKVMCEWAFNSVIATNHTLTFVEKPAEESLTRWEVSPISQRQRKASLYSCKCVTNSAPTRDTLQTINDCETSCYFQTFAFISNLLRKIKRIEL